jgi:hypothetical protein
MIYLTITTFTLPVPDGKPVIGPVPGLSNVYLAAGHEGGGLSMVSFHTANIFIIKRRHGRTFMINRIWCTSCITQCMISTI